MNREHTSKTSRILTTPGCWTCPLIPVRSTVRSSQKANSARGPPASALRSPRMSMALCTSLTCLVQWIKAARVLLSPKGYLHSNLWIRSLSCADLWTSERSSAGTYKTVVPRAKWTASVSDAMNLWSCPVNSFFSESGQAKRWNQRLCLQRTGRSE